MAKFRFKLKFAIPSFQLCRSKRLSTFPGNPIPSIYRLSPKNPKTHDIGYPNLPAPPPSTPEQYQCMIVSPKFTCTACNQHVPLNYCTTRSPDIIHCESTFCKMGRDKTTKASVSSGRSDLLINKFNSNIEEESENLLSCLTSFSDEFCHDEIVHYSPDTANYKPEKVFIGRHGKKISSLKKVQRQSFQASENRRGSETEQKKKKKATTSRASMTHCSVEGMVKDSFAVVKKSKDPYEDFKKSMLEMIMEMEIFEAEDLEQLLQCFLALNSRSFHGVIVRAFMETWQQLFYEPCVDQKSHNNRR